MVQTKTLRGGKRKVTSTYFDDIKLYKETINDTYASTSFKERHTTMRDKIIELKIHAVAQSMILSKLGCWEVSEYAKHYKGKFEDLVLDYGPAVICNGTYDDMQEELKKLYAVEHKTDDQLERIAELEAECKDIDDFCEEAAKEENKQQEEPEKDYRRGTIW